MTQHLRYVAGCHRCALSQDEAAHALAEELFEASRPALRRMAAKLYALIAAEDAADRLPFLTVRDVADELMTSLRLDD